MPAGEATKLILLNLLETMRTNEAGIKADIDVEFLHDYRVAVRRTRTALSEIRKVLPKSRVRYFRGAFRVLGQQTNELRDLDTCLLAEASYRALLPEEMQEDISPLFDSLRARRPAVLGGVIAYLESERYACLIDEWRSFLVTPIGE
jgi:CHAD domain-containing protein